MRNRSVQPRLPASEQLTFRLNTEHRRMSCLEAGCHRRVDGWDLDVDLDSDLGRAQAQYIRERSGRRFDPVPESATGSVTFRFHGGQDCFNDHYGPVPVRTNYLVVGGDHRGNPTGYHRVHSGFDSWLNHSGTTLDNLRRIVDDRN